MSINYNSHLKLDPLSTHRTKNKNKLINTYKADPLVYDKNEAAIINEAIKIGYLIYPSKDILWKIFETQPNYLEFKDYVSSKKTSSKYYSKNSYSDNDNEYIIDLNVIRHLNLSNLHVLEIGDICYCERLQILNLSNNYLIRIDPLIQCTNLIRLDLHNNQISMLPDMKFWDRLKQLKILYLHNNPIGKLDSLRRLAASQSLEILTLYDTPLSLKKNYRHHVVNIVFTLKALDDYVVSDEEIIEDAKFLNNFSTKSQNLYCNLHIPPSKSNDYYDEIKLTFDLLKIVNIIISKNSPVHIIQKHIRGYLDRRYYKEIKETRIWAATRIQKWWRKLKKLQYKPPAKITKDTRKSVMSSISKQSVTFISHSKSSDKASSDLLFPLQTDFINEKNRRVVNNTPAHHKNNLIIDLSKLQNRSSSMLDTSINEVHPFLDSTFNIYGPNDRSRSEFDVYQLVTNQIQQTNKVKQSPHSKDSSRKKKLRKINMAKFFELGQMLNKLSDLEGQSDSNIISALDSYGITDPEKLQQLSERDFQQLQTNQQEIIDEDEQINKSYRLPLVAMKTKFKLQDRFIVDLINEKKIYRNFVQEVEIESHKKLYEMRENPDVIKKNPIKTNDQRFFQKIFGTMTLGCLRAVDKAYLDRTNSERQQLKSQAIQKYKENKEFTHQQVNYYREERLREVQKIRERDRLHLTVAKRRLDLERMQNREIVQEQKSRFKDVNQERRKDVLLAVDFNKQHLSVSKALQKHEFNLSKENSLKKNNQFVEKQRITTNDQQEIVKKYLQQRNLLRITQTLTDREKIDSKILQDANDRLISAKKRVSKLKAANNASSNFYALHNRTKTSGRTISSVAIPSALFDTTGKTPHTETLRVTVLDTTALPLNESSIGRQTHHNPTPPISIDKNDINDNGLNVNQD